MRVSRDEKHLQSEINGLRWKPEYVDSAIFDRAVAAVPPEKRDAAFQAYLRDRRDTATPLSTTLLLERLDEGHLLKPASCRHLLDILQQTTTMPDRLKAGVPDGWTIGHKTGTSGEWRGVTAATNDVGIITGPKGEKIYISVFIAESRASAADRAALIANIARMAIENYK
jgi:beta-lactamase class A